MQRIRNRALYTVDSDSVIPQEKQIGGDKYHQATPYDKNESNKSFEEYASKIIEQNTGKTIEENVRKKFEKRERNN